MPALLELQRGFAAALLHEQERGVWTHIVEDGFSAAERLRIYRNTCRATLVASLRMTYPAVERIVGADFFEAMAERYVAARPALSGYLNDYGGDFAAFVAAFEPARELAYLPDVARYDWALSVAANAPDAPTLDPHTLLALAPEQRERLCFGAHPSVRFLLLEYPADEIADAVLAGDEAAMADVDLTRRAVHLVVHRGADGIESERLVPAVYEFISRLCGGEMLGQVLATAPSDAAVLLAQQFAKGRLSSYRVGE